MPDGWTEVTNPDYIVEKYDPRAPTLFEFDGDTVGVHVLPDEPNVPHADREAWRVGFVRGERDNLQNAEPFDHCHGRETALHVAYDFMHAYNDYADLPDEERVEKAKAAATE